MNGPDTTPTEIPAPDPEVAEILAFLEEDDSRLGDVYWGRVKGLTADQIAEELGVKTSNFVWNYTQILDALIKRDLPTAPSVARQVARRFRSLLKREWSEDVRRRLEEDLRKVERLATDVDALVEETAAAREQTAKAEEAAQTGIYVYALPHYLRYPFDPESGRTLLKVGRSDRDVIQRIQEQARTTALPEEPVLLRIYPTGDDDTVEVERRIHHALRAFDHARAVERMAGREWFLTTTRALDALADLLGKRDRRQRRRRLLRRVLR